MSYNDHLARRVRQYLNECRDTFIAGTEAAEISETTISSYPQVDSLEERQVFGGLAFLVNGKLALALIREDLVLRTGPYGKQSSNSAVVTLVGSDGNLLHDWLLLSGAVVKSDQALHQWINLALDYTSTLTVKL